MSHLEVGAGFERVVHLVTSALVLDIAVSKPTGPICTPSPCASWGRPRRADDALQEASSRAQMFAGRRTAIRAVVDGLHGFVAFEAGAPAAVLAFTVRDGRITAIEALVGERLAALDLAGFAG